MKVTGKFVQIPSEFLHGGAAKKMDSIEMLIYIYLSSYCFDDKKDCFPTQETIAKDLGLSTITVKRKIKYMMMRKIIEIKSIGRMGKSNWNTYILTSWENIDKLEDWHNIRNESIPKIPDPKDTTVGIPKIPREVSQRYINNTKVIIRSNNKNLAADAASKSNTTEAQENKGRAMDTTEIEDKLVNESIDPYADNIDDIIKTEDNKEIEYSCPDNPNISMYQLSDTIDPDKLVDKIYTYFKTKKYDNCKYKNKLIQFVNELSNDAEAYNMLVQSYSYLHAYWTKDRWYGDGSLMMYIFNYDKFYGDVTNERNMLQHQWEQDNNDELVAKLIKDNNIYDPRIYGNAVWTIWDKYNLEEKDESQAIWLKKSIKKSIIKYVSGNLFIDGEVITSDKLHYISVDEVAQLTEGVK